MIVSKPALLVCSMLVLSISACSWVKLTPEGESVRVASKEDITACKKIGKTTVSLKAKIAGINRNKKKIEAELKLLAKNSAASMGGNTVLPVSKTENGEKTFEVYECDDK